ncbi:MAG: hypothetical protein U0792_00630 [Gemmataceae bacterium]
MTSTRFFSGLDLGTQADFSALVVVEQGQMKDEDGFHVPTYTVRHLERWHLGTRYPQIVDGLVKRFAEPPLARSTLVIDSTGVGAPVVDMIRTSGIDATISPWVITAGFKEGDGTVPKRDLVGAIQATLGTKRLKIVPTLPEAAALVKELEAFRVKVTADRNETFAAWREKDHDDLVLALALAVWFGERSGLPVCDKRTLPHFIRLDHALVSQ